MLKAIARQRLAAGQEERDLGLDDASSAVGGPLEIACPARKYVSCCELRFCYMIRAVAATISRCCCR